jgi:curli biogenesis system outer membrane secretion channel CsgG
MRSLGSTRALGRILALLAGLAMMGLAGGCATVDKGPERTQDLPVSEAVQQAAQEAAVAPAGKIYKRKVAIGRFSNESRYGRALLVDQDLDPLGKQASDVLVTELERSNRFLVFERPDIEKIAREQSLEGKGELVGVDALILGSITEFGRVTEGKSGFLSSTKRQTVRAAVNLRLVEISTGRVFFSADGVGEAINESGEVAGFGSKAAYDATLNEKAIHAAINEVIEELVTELAARPWRTTILDVQGGAIYVSGGPRQGLQVGDELVVMRAGKTVKSGQTGMPIELPGTEVGRLTVTSQFGSDEVNEGSACTLKSGAVKAAEIENLYIVESEVEK